MRKRVGERDAHVLYSRVQEPAACLQTQNRRPLQSESFQPSSLNSAQSSPPMLLGSPRFQNLVKLRRSPDSASKHVSSSQAFLPHRRSSHPDQPRTGASRGWELSLFRGGTRPKERAWPFTLEAMPQSTYPGQEPHKARWTKGRMQGRRF